MNSDDEMTEQHVSEQYDEQTAPEAVDSVDGRRARTDEVDLAEADRGDP